MDEKQQKLLDLHDKIIQEIIDFCNKEGYDKVEEVILGADSFSSSIKNRKWMPCTDSSLIFKDKNGNIINYSM